MPKGIVDTPSKEKKWEKAKDIAAKQGKAERWPLVMHIFKQMVGVSKADEETNVKIERALAAQGKKTTIPQEAHEVLHGWWQQNKDKLLSPEQKKMISDIKQVKERRAGLKLVKKTYLSEMYSALTALKNEFVETLEKAKKPHYSWELSDNHTEEELNAIKQLVDKGWDVREAAHLVSPETGSKSEAKNFQDALKSRVGVPDLSPNMLNELKSIADQWLSNYKQTQKHEQHINPENYAASQAKKIHDQHASDYTKAYSDFVNSDDVKPLKGSARVKAISNWKKKWHEDNPQHVESLKDASEKAANIANQSKQARQNYISEVTQSLAHGGYSGSPIGQEGETMSASEAKEHLYQGKDDEDEQAGPSTKTNPYTSFAAGNKGYVEHLRSKIKPEQMSSQESPEITQEDIKAYHDHSKKFQSDFQNFLSSTDFTKLSGPEKSRKSREFSENWHKSNPSPKNAEHVAKLQESYEPEDEAEEPEEIKPKQAAIKPAAMPSNRQQISGMAKPEQLDRLKNVDAAKLSMKSKKD